LFKNRSDSLKPAIFLEQFPYLRKKFQGMETTKKSTAISWLLFFLFVALTVVMYFSDSFANYITATLPFIVYYFAKALDLI
jgi:hypothetical protein